MQIINLSQNQEKLLDEFAASHPYGSLEQTWAWGELQTQIPGRPDFHVLGVFEGEKLVASVLVVRQEMGFGKTWLWCPRGPLLCEGSWDLLKKELKKLAKKHGDIYVRIEPGVPENEKFIDGKFTKECYMPVNTLLIDLEQSEEEILAQMTQKGRYNIKVADRYNVKIKETKDVDTFYKILKETAQRDGFHVHEKEFYEDFSKILGKKAKLYGAFIEDEMVGGLLATFFGKTATYYFGASAGKHRNAMAPYALQWHAIREAKKSGYKSYDFLGIAPEGDGKHVLSGVTQFKTRFGGKRVDYHKPIVIVYRPLWNLIVRTIKAMI